MVVYARCKMNLKTLYHGSSEIVRQPIFGKGKPYNDYGQGFYCTESMELAKEWACTESTEGSVNEYEIDTDSLRILNLSGSEYTILHWLALLVNNRPIRTGTPVARKGVEFLAANYLPDISEYDAMIGYRADDSYFSFARAFIGNEISLKQLGYAMKLGKLGEQFVLKSEKAFQLIRFISAEKVEHSKYYPLRKQRDDDARKAYQTELERDDLNGLFMRDIVRERILPDDPRLR